MSEISNMDVEEQQAMAADEDEGSDIILMNAAPSTHEDAYMELASNSSMAEGERGNLTDGGSEAAGSDATESEVAESDAAGSDVAESEVAETDAAGSDAAESEVAESDAAGSDVAESEVAESDAAESEVADTASSGAGDSSKRTGTYSKEDALKKLHARIAMSDSFDAEDAYAVASARMRTWEDVQSSSPEDALVRLQRIVDQRSELMQRVMDRDGLLSPGDELFDYFVKKQARLVSILVALSQKASGVGGQPPALI